MRQHAVPRALQSALSQLNLSNKDLLRLKARLILVADRADNMIPYTQSLELLSPCERGKRTFSWSTA